MKKLIFILVISMLLVSCGGSDSDELDVEELERSCVDAGGTFVAEHIECEYKSEDTCTDLGGTFDECGSACRHEEGPVACTANCVLVCSFEPSGGGD